jgi:hypothetical protein
MQKLLCKERISYKLLVSVLDATIFPKWLDASTSLPKRFSSNSFEGPGGGGGDEQITAPVKHLL